MCAVPNMAVFCSSLTSWFPGMLLTYFLSDFGKVPVAPTITGITFVVTFHLRCTSNVKTKVIPVIIGANGTFPLPFRKYVSNIPGKHEVIIIIIIIIIIIGHQAQDSVAPGYDARSPRIRNSMFRGNLVS